MRKENLKTLSIVAVFSIAMAFLESAVVIYLRKAYYPKGFDFPLSVLEPNILATELIREFATIVMLVCIGLLAGKTIYQKLSYFLISFGIWDIGYYVFLKAVIDWPSSLLTWDILFLIPWAWYGPVLAPIIISITLVALGILLIRLDEKDGDFKPAKSFWSLLLIGWLIQLYTMTYQIGWLVLSGKSNEIINFIPSSFNWILFVIGEIFIIGLIMSLYTKRWNNSLHI
jgi:hypothetical protein